MRALHILLREKGVPPEAFPLVVPKGNKNFTIKDVSGAVVEIQHVVGKYYVKRKKDNEVLGAGESPSVAWSRNGGDATKAWQGVLAMTGVTAWRTVVKPCMIT